MRKIVTIMFVCGLFVLVAGQELLAGDIEWGLKTGITRSKANISQNLPGATITPLKTYSFSSHIAIFFVKDWLGLQPEIHLSIKGFDMLETDQGQEISSKYKISYIKIPLLISCKFPLAGRLKPGMVIGPYIGLANKVQEVQSAFGVTEERELGDNLKKTDFGILLGGNVRYEMGKMTVILAARYSIGLVSISKDIQQVAYDFDSNDTIKNRALSIMFGIALNL